MIVKQRPYLIGTAILGTLFGTACNQAMLIGRPNPVALLFGATSMMCLGVLVGSANAFNSRVAALLGGLVGILAGLIASAEIKDLLFNGVLGLICGYMLSTTTDYSTTAMALRQAVNGAIITALLAIVALLVVYLVDSNGLAKTASLRPEAAAVVLNASLFGAFMLAFLALVVAKGSAKR